MEDEAVELMCSAYDGQDPLSMPTSKSVTEYDMGSIPWKDPGLL